MPLGAALLAKVYGVASMQSVTLLLALPCCFAIFALWVWALRSGKELLASAIGLGAVGGLLGTIGYDVARFPFALAGQRIYAPISAYGMWLANANLSSRFTDILGWSYHFGNGITFGIMYALFMRGRHWFFAIVWAFTLETIALVSPFARIFYLSGNYSAIGIAYLGHIGYGLPLGWLIYQWNETRLQLAEMTSAHRWVVLIFGCAVVAWPLLSPGNVRRDARATSGVFRVESYSLNPDWLRINANSEIQVYNPGPETVSVRLKQCNVSKQIVASEKSAFSFRQPGIYQIFVETSQRSQSSFVIVEPIEKFR